MFLPGSNITGFVSISDLFTDASSYNNLIIKYIFLFCRLERTLQHVVQQKMDAVDLSGGYTAAILWQKFAVMDRKEYFHCIITIANTGAGTNTV
jgi:hypothetical protein